MSGPESAHPSSFQITLTGGLLLAAHLLVVLGIAYVMAYDAISGSWANLLALPLWALLALGAVLTILLADQHLGRWIRVGVGLLAFFALPLAALFAPTLEGLAQFHRKARVQKAHQAHQTLTQRHCRELRQRLNGPRKVVDAVGWFPILEGGFGVELVDVPARMELTQRFKQTLVGKTVIVQVAPDCTDRYLPNAASGLLFDYGLVEDGQGHSYGAVPVHLWNNQTWLNRPFMPDRLRRKASPPEPPSLTR